MPESSEGGQPSPVEQGNIPLEAKEFRPETLHIPGTEPRSDEALGKLERGDVVGYMDEENIRYLRENAETPEQAEQLVQIYENAKKLQENIAKFSKDDAAIPASEETKLKLKLLDVAENLVGEGPEHGTAFRAFLLPSLIGGVFETLNFASGGSISAPGFSAEVGLAIGAALGGSLEGMNLAKIGIEKLKALRDKNKATGAEVPQPSRLQTGGNKK